MTLGTCPVGCILLHVLSRGLDLSPAWAWCHAALPREPHGRRKKEGWAEPVPVARPSPRGREGKYVPKGWPYTQSFAGFKLSPCNVVLFNLLLSKPLVKAHAALARSKETYSP